MDRIRQINLFLWLAYGFLLGIFALLIWTGKEVISQPYSGILWNLNTGVVDSISPNGPAAGRLLRGDKILTINNMSVDKARNLPNAHIGEAYDFHIQRGIQEQTVVIRLAAAPLSVILSRLVPILMAGSFWFLGVFILAFVKSSPARNIFFVFCLIVTAFMSLGAVAASGPEWAAWAYRFLLIWAGPMSVHAHIYFPLSYHTREMRILYRVLYILAAILSCMIAVQEIWEQAGLLARQVSYLWLGLNAIILAGLLLSAYFRASTLEMRQRVTIVVLAALVGFLPSVVFVLIPTILLSRSFIPAEAAFLFLMVLPIGYGYAIIRHRLLELDGYLHRSAAYALTAILIGLGYGLPYLLLPQWEMGASQAHLWIEWAVMLLLTLCAYPLYQAIFKKINQLFYGGWYDDFETVKQVSQALSQESDIHDMGRTLCHTLRKVMQLEYAHILFADGTMLFSGKNGAEPENKLEELDSEAVRQSLARLQSSTEQDIGIIHSLRKSVMPDLGEEVSAKLLGKSPHIWLLLRGKASPMALLVLGKRLGGGEFDSTGLHTLEIIVRQARTAMENSLLLDEAYQHTQMIRELHHQLLQTRYEERKSLARELHDRTIQSLAGVSMQLAKIETLVPAPVSDDLHQIQNEVRYALDEAREICTNLRPVSIEAVGLAQTLRTRTLELSQSQPFDITIDIEDEKEEPPEQVVSGLYQVFQEAIRNIKKHAEATSVKVYLNITNEQAILSIRDDGKGFFVPDSLSKLSSGKHFGLVGLEELTQSLGGSLCVQSSPGHGCYLVASIPLSPETSPNSLHKAEKQTGDPL